MNFVIYLGLALLPLRLFSAPITDSVLASNSKAVQRGESEIPLAINFFSLALDTYTKDPNGFATINEDFCQIKSEHILLYLQQTKYLWDEFLSETLKGNRLTSKKILRRGLRQCHKTCSCDLWEISLKERDSRGKFFSKKELEKEFKSARKASGAAVDLQCKKVSREFCSTPLFKKIHSQVLENL
jgi:hypothetical protein